MSAGEDRRVNIWDITRLGARQGVEERKYGPPELMFQHAGHRFPVRPLRPAAPASARASASPFILLRCPHRLADDTGREVASDAVLPCGRSEPKLPSWAVDITLGGDTQFFIFRVAPCTPGDGNRSARWGSHAPPLHTLQ